MALKVTVVFVRVVTKPEYDHGSIRWAAAYNRFHAGHEHELIIINRYADPIDNLFLGAKQIRYDGGGWDCGAWQFAGKNIDTDLLVCFNSSTYVTGDNWLKRFVEAVETHGVGLYGPLASYEVNPHIRTPCMIFQPEVIRDYPNTVETREDTWRFECLGWPDGTPNFTEWVYRKGMQTMAVYWDDAYSRDVWRSAPNIFRRGDQSNLIVKDRHVEAYEVSDYDGKRTLERLADGV